MVVHSRILSLLGLESDFDRLLLLWRVFLAAVSLKAGCVFNISAVGFPRVQTRIKVLLAGGWASKFDSVATMQSVCLGSF